MQAFHWRCPSCSLPLNPYQGYWQCDNKHTFDIAKQGYINLLLAHTKKSKIPGDSKEMVVARRDFLQRGHYHPLVAKIAELIVTHNPCENNLAIFDAGCGEGYYLNSVTDLLHSSSLRTRVSGVDISKVAVQKAAKLVKQGYFAVASTYSIPVISASQDIVIQIFAPSDDTEILRILKQGGYWLNVSPAPEHLFELKQRVYDTPQQHQVEPLKAKGFELVATQQLRFTINLEDEQVREALLLMTPFYWQISAQKKDALKASLQSVTAHFNLQMLRKTE